VRRALLAAVGLAIALPSAVAAQPGLPLKLLVLPSPGTPEAFSGDGKTHVAYEFFLANFTDQTIQIDSLAIAGAEPNSKAKPVTSNQANPVQFRAAEIPLFIDRSQSTEAASPAAQTE